ncbi:hypothetical protein [Lewinella cohaerens]|uniref:hypothetical protein n=1 Tax=Lewinella cohaerens TaxID=70995 RepID=UPI0003745F07|nr:hypothetical protein [Lewinella cohaerens]
MKLIKIYVVLTVLSGIAYLVFSDYFFSFSKNEEVLNQLEAAPKEENSVINADLWEQALIGKWHFKQNDLAENIVGVLEGEVEYFPTGEFIRKFTYSRFECFDVLGRVNHSSLIKDTLNISPQPECLQYIIGIGYQGTYKIINDEGWIEQANQCEEATAYSQKGISPPILCKHMTAGEQHYGNKNNMLSTGNIIHFDQNKIIIETFNYSSGAKVIYKAYKEG